MQLCDMEGGGGVAVRVIASEARGGRGLAAARGFSKGEEILVEPAAVVGPAQADGDCCVACSR